jgi:hypothetical protein
MAGHQSESNGIRKGVLVLAFLFFLAILWKFTDLFTSIIGTLLLVAVFAVDYNRRNGHIH